MNKPTHMTADTLDAFGAEVEAIKQRTLADIGQRDATYIRNMVRKQRGLAIASRLTIYAALSFMPLLPFGFVSWPAFWGLLALGTLGLGIAKILDNMEIGHNIMHGQYDWMGDPRFHSKSYDWDTTCPGDQWMHSHNYMHHTYTNILGKDRDIGYGILRMDEDQYWNRSHLANPINAFFLMMLFDMGVALHDVEFDRIWSGKRSWKEAWPVLKGVFRKTSTIWKKDFLLFPLLAGPFFPVVFAANLVANLIRNIWSFSIIFCGHFPQGVQTFSEADCQDESQGHWYYRQLLGSANIEGGKLFHIMSGNLSHQIEHHLFPDIPAHRYAELSVEVQEICARYGLQYNKGSFWKQIGTVWGKIFRLALPPKRKLTATLA